MLRSILRWVEGRTPRTALLHILLSLARLICSQLPLFGHHCNPDLESWNLPAIRNSPKTKNTNEFICIFGILGMDVQNTNEFIDVFGIFGIWEV